MDHPGAGAQPGDLVLQLELSSLEFRNLEVIGGWMGHGVLDFPFERLVPPFELAQMDLQLHASVPPIAVPTARQYATDGAPGEAAMRGFAQRRRWENLA